MTIQTCFHRVKPQIHAVIDFLETSVLSISRYKTLIYASSCIPISVFAIIKRSFDDWLIFFFVFFKFVYFITLYNYLKMGDMVEREREREWVKRGSGNIRQSQDSTNPHLTHSLFLYSIFIVNRGASYRFWVAHPDRDKRFPSSK